MAFARGKRSMAISDRSGQAFPYVEMVREWNGSLVHISEFEPKHPQIRRKKVTADAIALQDARPQDININSGGKNFTTVNLNLPGDFAFSSQGMIPDDGSAQNRARQLSSNLGSVIITGVDIDVVAEAESVSSNILINDVIISNDADVEAGSVSSNILMNDVTIVTPTLTTYAVTVQSTLYGNKYYIDGVQQDTLSMTKGSTYQFDQSDSSNSGHPLRLSTTSNGTHGGGVEYTTGVTKVGTPGSSGAYTQIVVDASAPSTLYYYCSVHSGMGGQINIS